MSAILKQKLIDIANGFTKYNLWKGGGSSKLSELNDVTLTNLQSNDVLTYNGSEWVNDDNLQTQINTLNSNLNSEISRAKESDEILSLKVTQNTNDISALKTADNVLSSRIDTFTSLTEGSTTGDAELLDIRVKSDGTASTSAGNAVREQISELKGDIDNYKALQINPYQTSFFNYSNENLIKNNELIFGKFCETNGIIFDNQFWCYSKFDIEPSINYVAFNVPKNTRVVFFNSNDNVVSGELWSDDKLFNAPDGSAYVIFSFIMTSINDFSVFEYNGYKSPLLKNEYIDLNFMSKNIKISPQNTTFFDFSQNLIYTPTAEKDKYVDAYYGNSSDAQGYAYVVIEVDGNTEYKFEDGSTNTHIAYFNTSEIGHANYISGEVVNTESCKITTPSNAIIMTVSWKYKNDAIWCNKSDVTYVKTQLKSLYLPKTTEKKVVYVGVDEEYTSVLKALKENDRDTIIKVKRGTYNIVNEYKSEYGNDFFDVYAGFYSSSDVFYRGLSLGNGVELIGETGANLVFDYDGSNEYVFSSFSLLALTSNNIIDNMTFNVNRNCQYIIHDDFANSIGKNIIRNNTFIGVQCGTAIIGAGFGENMEYEVTDNIFLQDYSTSGHTTDVFEELSIMYHSCNIAGSKSRILISGNYCSGGINLWKFGISTEMSYAIVSNNTATRIECKGHPRGGTSENITMYEFNNTIHN